jgi:tetratricopeptide (TPR) repeat protein
VSAVVNEHGLEFTGSQEAVGLFDQAIDDLAHFRGKVLDSTAAALTADPDFALGQALNAYLRLLTTEVQDFEHAKVDWAVYQARRADRTNPTRLLPREQAHLSTVDALLAGDLTSAGAILRQLTVEHPRDLLALIVGHQIDFFTGDALALRDRPGGASAAWTQEDRHLGPVLGMYAFGLEEAGQYDRSEDTGRRAVELDPRDVWGIHSVAHTYEMQGRFDDGTRYFDERRDSWTSPENFFRPHNWWHYCLYALEAGELAKALEIYDRELHNDQTEWLAMQMLDASALLWRFYLEGHDETARWRALVEPWESKMTRPFYAFNDFHAVMSYVGAGEIAKAEQLIDERRRWVIAGHGPETNLRMTARLGIPVCEALVAFGKGNYDRATDLLAPLRVDFQGLGGSHAQRDALQRTLVESALRSGRHDLARRLIAERLDLRPSSPYNLLKKAQLELQPTACWPSGIGPAGSASTSP